MDKQKYMATNDENIIELKHTPGVCCPERGRAVGKADSLR